jgi:hypothetical protein
LLSTFIVQHGIRNIGEVRFESDPVARHGVVLHGHHGLHRMVVAGVDELRDAQCSEVCLNQIYKYKQNKNKQKQKENIVKDGVIK